jgi:glycosyltransferase involved in cell wall biosynthesis
MRLGIGLKSVSATIKYTKGDMAMPAITIVMPVYQGASFIRGAVHSILSQTFRDYELIIVDDGSTDHPETQIADVVDERIRIIRQENQGTSVARNHGIKEAQAPYVTFLDVDDRWLPRKLEVDMTTLRSRHMPEALVYGGYYLADERYRPVWKVNETAEGMILTQVIANQRMLLPSATIVHRRVINVIGGFSEQGVMWSEDRVFFLHACNRFPAYPTGQTHVIYRRVGGRHRAILADYDKALSCMDIVIRATKTKELADVAQQIERMELRSLVITFVMNGYLQHAIRLTKDQAIDDLGSELRPRLAAMSLRLGINLLHPAAQAAGMAYSLSSPLLMNRETRDSWKGFRA